MCEWTDYVGAKFKSLTQLHLPPISNSEPHLPPCERFKFADNEMLETFLKVWNRLILTGLLSGRWMCSINSARKEINYFEKMHFPVIFTTLQTSVSSTPNLSRFAVETRKTDGSKYPPATIHQLLYGVLKHKREVNLDCINFLNKKDPWFKQLHGTLDVLFHRLHSEGLGTKMKSACSHQRRWAETLRSGVLSLDTSKML